MNHCFSTNAHERNRTQNTRIEQIWHGLPLRTLCLSLCSLWFLFALPQRAKSLFTKHKKKIPHPCFGVAKTSLSLPKERDVAQRQGEVKHKSPLRTLCLSLCSLWFLFALPQRAKSLFTKHKKKIPHPCFGVAKTSLSLPKELILSHKNARLA